MFWKFCVQNCFHLFSGCACHILKSDETILRIVCRNIRTFLKILSKSWWLPDPIITVSLILFVLAWARCDRALQMAVDSFKSFWTYCFSLKFIWDLQNQVLWSFFIFAMVIYFPDQAFINFTLWKCGDYVLFWKSYLDRRAMHPVQPNQDFNPWSLGHDKIFHVPVTLVLTTEGSGTSISRDERACSIIRCCCSQNSGQERTHYIYVCKSPHDIVANRNVDIRRISLTASFLISGREISVECGIQW